jgi:hypothetical protein
MVICHQVPGFNLIWSTIHQMMSPTPSNGAMKLQGEAESVNDHPEWQANKKFLASQYNHTISHPSEKPSLQYLCN